MFFKPGFVKDAQERRRLLKKVFYYRRNELSAADAQALNDLAGRFATALKKPEKSALKKLELEAEKLLKKSGGHYFKHYHFFENVETLVVAAILAIGIRSFFLQPFKIPTNSMWPTYHGMVYTLTDGTAPNPLARAARLVLQGVSQYRVVAPVSGPVQIELFDAAARERQHEVFAYRTVRRPWLGVIPMLQRQYVFIVGGQPVELYVPVEFSLDKLLIEKFFASAQKLAVDAEGRATLTQARAGEAFLSFELESGDMLFVDRFSYQFTSPKVGDPIVFRTRAIPGLTALYDGTPDDKYYIKRLVGLPGDQLKIEDPILYRNGQPISGSPIFVKDLQRQPPYPGYQARYNLAGNATVTVPEGSFYAFGDNSPESLDSRAWGGLPQREVIGKAVFIYYPFTNRWGFSK